MKSLALLSCVALSLMCPMDSFGQTSPTELREAPSSLNGDLAIAFSGISDLPSGSENAAVAEIVVTQIPYQLYWEPETE